MFGTAALGSSPSSSPQAEGAQQLQLLPGHPGIAGQGRLPSFLGQLTLPKLEEGNAVGDQPHTPAPSNAAGRVAAIGSVTSPAGTSTTSARDEPEASGEEDGDGEDEGGSAATFRKKLRLTKDQFAVLEDIFQKHQRLTPKHKGALAAQLGVRIRQVEVWFQNRRARTKVKQTEADREALRQHCEALMAENRRLQNLLEDARQQALPQLLPQQPPATVQHQVMITLCPSCQHLGQASELGPLPGATAATAPRLMPTTHGPPSTPLRLLPPSPPPSDD
eukprot:SM000112S23961  [mRNA]  locus=s112:85679:86884:+ [translate_table: standard]